MKTTPSGRRHHLVGLQNPTTAPDGQGNYTETWTDCAPPTAQAEIRPTGSSDLERVQAGTVTANASHLIAIPYQADVTTKTRVTYGPRVFSVLGVMNPDERNIELALLCAEVVP
jgi:SPP1 family predicted phage head-tail adaptor